MLNMTKVFGNRPFDKLKKQLERRTDAPPLSTHPPSPQERPVTEQELFEDAMADVHMIEEFRVLPCRKTSRRNPPEREQRDPDDDPLAILGQIAGGEIPINLSDTQEYIEWTNPDVHREIAGRLHAGHFSVQGMLDLHGATGEGVNEELDGFLEEAFRRGWRCVKIIHGRGLRSVRGPVLKDAVARRLAGRYRKQVIAFVSARQCDGGLGALYVLLGRA